MEDSQAGRRLAALRKTREKTCPVCGTVFEAFAKQAYDSKLCANRASYARHAEKRRAEKREQYRRMKQEGGCRPSAPPHTKRARTRQARNGVHRATVALRSALMAAGTHGSTWGS